MAGFDIGGGIGGFAGGIVGNIMGGDAQAQARENMRRAIEAYQGLSTPDLQALLQQMQAGDSAAASMDPAARNAQMDALTHMQQVYQTGGMTPADQVAQDQAMATAAASERAQRGATMQDLATRGQLGGGAELAARLSGQQGTNIASHNAGGNAAAAAQGRALAAMQGSGQLAGQARTQDLAKAQAQDVMSQFNAAQRGNAYSNDFGNRLAKTQGIAGAYTGMAGYENADAQRQRNQWSGMGQGVGSAIGKWIGG